MYYSSNKDDEMPIAELKYDKDEQEIQEEVNMNRLEILQYLLAEAVIHDPDHPSIVGLLTLYQSLMPIDCT